MIQVYLYHRYPYITGYCPRFLIDRPSFSIDVVNRAVMADDWLDFLATVRNNPVPGHLEIFSVFSLGQLIN